ncbi:MAG: hypothetical protein AAFX06_24355 [Planctomycetota bacterium]
MRTFRHPVRSRDFAVIMCLMAMMSGALGCGGSLPENVADDASADAVESYKKMNEMDASERLAEGDV